MSRSHSLKVHLISAAIALALGAGDVLAGSLTLIPTLGVDTSNEGRAITPDGRYVVGNSGPAGTHGFLYDVGTGLAANVLSSDGAQSTAVTGVGYRYVSGQEQVVMSGLTGSGYAQWMTTDSGVSFGVKRRDTNLGTSPWTIPAANGMAGTSSDAYYGVFRDNVNYLRVERASGAWPATVVIDTKSVPTGSPASMNGISSTGRAVGYRQVSSTSSTKQNYVMDWTGGGAGSVFFFNGLANDTYGQAFSVSADGMTIFGQSPVVAGNVGPNYGYKATFAGQARQTITALPLFGDETGSTSLQVPYGCTQDGAIAAGMDYRGTEKAVLWVTFDPDPANWYVIDLTERAAAEGILDGFMRLNRAYSVGWDDAGNYVVTGTGAWSPDGGATTFTRAFVMTVVPEPSVLSLLALGGLLLLRRRQR